MNDLNRRDFLKTASAISAVAAFPAIMRGQQVRSPNDKLDVGIIGCDGKGEVDSAGMASENIVALCDVDENHAEMFKQLPAAKKYKDFRVMLAEMGDKIDAVLVGTPDHTQ